MHVIPEPHARQPRLTRKGEKIVTETKFLEESNFMLQKGGFLPSVRLAYRTIGALNAAKDNAILIPS